MPMDYWPKVTPVIEEDIGYKGIGPGPILIEYCCLRGQEPKLTDKGKPIKLAKGATPLCLTPNSVSKESDEINRVLTWFTGKFRPHSAHLYATLLNRPDKACKYSKEIEKLAEDVRNDMEHI